MKRIMVCVLAMLLVLLGICPALAAVPAQPKEFAYAYDFEADVLDTL